MTTPPVPAGAELDSRRRVLRPYGAYTFNTFPFAHVQSSACLPEHQYEALSSTFPDRARFPMTAGRRDGGLLRIPSSRVLADRGFSEEWKWFVAQHTSQDFWMQILEIFGPQLHAGFQPIENRLGRPMNRWRAVRRGSGEQGDVTLECQLVLGSGEGASLVDAPHVGHATTLWTGRLDLRDPADDAEGGDLRLYRGLKDLRFDTHHAPHSQVVHEVTARYAANSFVGFVNGPQAIHSQSGRGPAAQLRRHVDLIVELDRPAFELPQMHPLRRRWHRLVHRRAGR